MKKTYKAPQSGSVSLVTERMLALSVDETTVDPGTSFSNEKNGWDSESWSAGEAGTEE